MLHVLSFALLMQLQITEEPQLYIHENEIWIGRKRELQQITSDKLVKDNLVLSPSGDAIAYVTYCGPGSSDACPPTLVFRNLRGDLLYSLPPLTQDGSTCFSVVGLDWIDKDRIGVKCHVNPSLIEYPILSISTAKVIASYYGGPFSWSPDRKSLAYGGPVRHFSPPYAHSFYLCVDNKVIYPQTPVGNASRADLFPRAVFDGEKNGCDMDHAPSVVELQGSTFAGIHDLFSDLAWAPDGRAIGFVEQIYDWRAPAPSALNGGDEVNQRYQAVVVQLDGRYERHVLNGATRQPHLFEWNSRKRFNVRGDSGIHWAFDRETQSAR